MAEPAEFTAATMYDPQTGAALQVDAARVGDLYRSGQATFGADQDVPIVGPDGRVTTIKGRDAAAYFQSVESLTGGAASNADLARQRADEQFGGVGGAALAAAAGAGRGLTFGLSDQALVALGGEQTRATLRGLQEVNPNASLGGEVLGALAPALATGGSAAAGRLGLGAVGRGGLVAAEAATALPRGVAAVGRAAEGLTARLAGEGLVGRALASGAGAAAEGALYGVGQEISRAAITNNDLTAERLMAAMGHGALLGGAAGAGLGAGATLLRRAADRAGEAGAALLRRGEAAEAKLTGELASAAPKTEAGVRGVLSDLGREQAIKATGADAAIVRQIKTAGRDVEDRIVRQLLEDAPRAVGKEPGALLSRAEKATAAKTLEAQAGKRVGDLVEQIGTSSARADVGALAAEFRTSKLVEMGQRSGPEATKAVKKLEGWLDDLTTKVAEGDAVALQKYKRDLGDATAWSPHLASYDKPVEALKRDLYRRVDQEIAALGEKAAPELGAGFAASWKNAKADYQAARLFRDAAEKGVERETANRAFGLSEQIGAAGGLAAGVLTGGGLAALPLAAAGALAQGVVKRYGSDVAAQFARAASKADVVRAIDGAVAKQFGERTAALLEGGRTAVREARLAAPIAVAAAAEQRRSDARAAVASERATARLVATSSASLAQTFQQRRDVVARFLAAPQQRTAAALQDLDDVPGLQAALATKIEGGARFLAGKLPTRTATTTLAGGEPQPTPAEMDRWLRYARAVDDPASVIDDAARGHVSREGVEALRAVYPELHAELQSRITAQLDEARAAGRPPPSYATLVQLTATTGVPGDRTLTPRFIQTMQVVYEQAPAAARGSVPGGPPARTSAPPPVRESRIPSTYTSRADTIGQGA